jgi:hypothetical protein
VCWDQSAEYGTYKIEMFFEKFIVMKSVPAAEENIEWMGSYRTEENGKWKCWKENSAAKANIVSVET